jgi:hypothetical protein
VNRWAPAPGSRPGICCCVVTEGHGSRRVAEAARRVRRSNEPAPRNDERSAEVVGRYGTPRELATRRRVVPLVRTVTPRGLGGPKRKAAEGRGGRRRDQSERQVEREHALEGESPGRDRRPGPFVVPATARTRCGKKALKPALQSAQPSGEARRCGVTTGGQWAPRGVPIATRGSP